DNDTAATFAGGRVWLVRTTAFVLSGLFATVAGILIGGFAGVTSQVGQGMEFTAITAVVLGGVLLGGGRGWIVGAIAGALTYQLPAPASRATDTSRATTRGSRMT